MLRVGIGLAFLSILIAAPIHLYPTSADEGAARIWKNADSGFDQYSADSTYAATINYRYQGMLVYEPYFDSHAPVAPLSWYTGDALFYKDAYAIYTDPARNGDGALAAWALKDANDNPCYIPWGTPPYDQYAGDIGSQVFRDNWIAYATDTLSDHPGYKGVFIDDVNLDDADFPGISRVSCGQANGSGNTNLPIDPRTGVAMTGSDWDRYFAEFMEQVRSATPGKTIAHNSIWYITSFTNPYLVRQIQAADIIEMEQGFWDSGLVGGTTKYSWSRKMDFVSLVHANSRIVIDRDENVSTDAGQEYGVANYFLLNNGSDYYDPIYRSMPVDPWNNVYGVSLGAAQGARYLWNGLWRRDFADGFVLVNPPGGTYTTVNLGGTYSDLYNGQHNSVTLSERQGKVFTPMVGDPVLVGAGDISWCSSTGDTATAALLDGIAGTVFTAGDNVYDSGTDTEFANCYDPTWGRHKARTRPAAGNHEYNTSGASGYYGYFGAAAGDPSKGYYSFDLGTWHVVVLNSNCSNIGDCGAGSAQEVWLRADLAAHPTVCTAAIWHHPLYSSGSIHGSSTATRALYQALYDAGAEVVITGHEHNYERFAPQDANGNLDSTGIREFVVGMGGKDHYGFGSPIANSEVRDNTSFGVLKLTLHASSYDWRFIPVAGQTFTDSGSASCSAFTGADSDGDGYGDVTEYYVGTNISLACPQTGTPNDELIDALPPDFNDDGWVDPSDVILMGSPYNTRVGQLGFDKRFDLSVDERVNLSDAILMGNNYNQPC